MFDKTWLCCKLCQCFHWVSIFFIWYSKGPYPLLFWQAGSGFGIFGICPCLGMEFVMNAIINKYSAVSSYLTVSNGLLENQWRIYVLLSLETESSKFWSVKYTKIRRKRWHSVFFKKLFIILYFSVKIASLTRFTNGFMNCSPTIIDLYLQLPLLFTFRNI